MFPNRFWRLLRREAIVGNGDRVNRAMTAIPHDPGSRVDVAALRWVAIAGDVRTGRGRSRTTLVTGPARLGVVRRILLNVIGGPARVRVVLVLGAVLGLNGADIATVSSATSNLEQVFHVGNTDIGLLISAVSLVSALGTIPIGVLTDRRHRTRLVATSILIWSVALVLSGAATSYWWLLFSRLALGVASATTGPTVSSLVGDFFPAEDRSRIYGMILGGELAGTGLGFLVSGEIAAMASWRLAFWWLVVPGLVLTFVFWRLPEPARGGQSQLEAGARRVRGRSEAPATEHAPTSETMDPADNLAMSVVEEAGVDARPELVLREDPTGQSIWWAVRYVLRIPTNLVIVIASALGYFFFAGLRSFAIIYVIGHYGLSQSVASALVVVIGIGALAGVFTGGRIADRLLRHGHIRARVVVPAVCLLAIGPVLAPAIATSWIGIALPLLVVGAALLAATNPPMDAARLDIIHARLWGRAEAVRTALRSLGEAAAPLLFGYASQYVFSGPGTSGLEDTFLLCLLPLLIAGLLALLALRTYPRDVATAAASVHALRDNADTQTRTEEQERR
jgi:MFS family permease